MRYKNLIAILLSMSFLFSISMTGQIKINPGSLDIYLVIGQSNMAGRAEIRKEDSLSVAGAFLYAEVEDGRWVEATNPLNRFSTIRKRIGMQRLGPAYSFVSSMISHRSERDIGLVVNAKGGTQIVQWLPGTRFYKEAVRRTKEALKFGKLKGVLWHQGESDNDPIRMAVYLSRIEILINALREEFDEPNLPFVAGQIYETEKTENFNRMLLNLPDFINYTGLVSSVGTMVIDGVHFDSNSTILLGQRYADQMIMLLKQLE